MTLQSQHLERLQASIESGKVDLIDHITDFASRVATRQGSVSPFSSNTNISANERGSRPCRRYRNWQIRLPLPRWLVGCVWEFGMHERDNVWTFQLCPINLRPAHTYVFDFVRAGDVGAVRELISSRQLSVHDREPTWNGHRTLLEASHMAYNISSSLLTSDRWQLGEDISGYANSFCKRPHILMKRPSHLRHCTHLLNM